MDKATGIHTMPALPAGGAARPHIRGDAHGTAVRKAPRPNPDRYLRQAMKRHLLPLLLTVLAAAGCTAPRHAASEPAITAESAWPDGNGSEGRALRRLRPLERPQVRFEVERAIRHADSAWVVVRIGIPHGSIRRRECFAAQFVLYTPEGIMEIGEVTLDTGGFTADNGQGTELATRRGQLRRLYLSTRFAWDERMGTGSGITVFTRLTDGRTLFHYLPLTLPLLWSDDTRHGLLWPYSAGIPENALLEDPPFGRR